MKVNNTCTILFWSGNSDGGLLIQRAFKKAKLANPLKFKNLRWDCD